MFTKMVFLIPCPYQRIRYIHTYTDIYWQRMYCYNNIMYSQENSLYKYRILYNSCIYLVCSTWKITWLYTNYIASDCWAVYRVICKLSFKILYLYFLVFIVYLVYRVQWDSKRKKSKTIITTPFEVTIRKILLKNQQLVLKISPHLCQTWDSPDVLLLLSKQKADILYMHIDILFFVDIPSVTGPTIVVHCSWPNSLYLKFIFWTRHSQVLF